jgi:hypothetical protein
MSVATLPRTVPFQLSPTGSTDSQVGLSYSVAISGIGFMLDLTSQQPYEWGYRPVQKEQRDTSDEPGERSLQTGYWRRARSSFHEGAGQEWADASDSFPHRFYSSKGIDPWTRNKLVLLPATERKRTSTNTNLKLLRAGSYLYMADGASVVFTSDPTPTSPSFTSVTGLSGGTVRDIASDGSRVYIAEGGTVKRAPIGAAGTAAWLTLASVDRIGMANGFFLAGAGRSLYVVSTTPAATDKTPAQVNLDATSSWAWVGFASGPNGPYAASKSGEKGWIYIGVIDSSGALDHFEIAAELPDGETVEAITTYLGQFMVIGTNRGVRVAQLGAGGEVNYGPLIDTGQPCQAFEPEDRFVFFGWPTYDGSDSGVGRLDLQTFTLPLKPAYATDLMSGQIGDVTGIITHSSKRFFVVSGKGLYGETTSKVSSGVLRTGKIRWSTLEEKYLSKVDLRTEPLNGSVQLEVAFNEGTFTPIETWSSGASTQHRFSVSGRGERCEARWTLTRASGDATLGPTVTGWVMLALPIVPQQRYFAMTLMCFDIEESVEGQQLGRAGSALDRLRQLQALKETQLPVDFQGPDYGVQQFEAFSSQTYRCVIEEISYLQNTPGGTEGFGGRVRILLSEVT